MIKRIKEKIGRLTAGSLRLAALVTAIGLASSAWADFVAGWDMSAIWERSLVASETTIASAPITCETPSGAIDFTMAARMTVPAGLTGAATLISWDMAHNKGPLEIFLVKDATSDGVARIKLGWAWKGSGDVTTYSESGQYYDWTVDNNPHDWTIAYEDNSAGTKVYLDGVKIAEVSGLRFAELVPTIRIGGATGSIVTPTYPVAAGLVVHAASYRQGNTFPTSLTSNGYTLNFNGNTPIVGGVAIGSATTGLSVTFASGDDFYNGRTISAVLEIENAPTTASDAMLVNFSYNGSYYIGLRTNGSALYQSWQGASTGYGSASWTPASHQTITFTSDRSSDGTRGTRTIIDSTEKIANVQGLCAGADIRSVQLGYYSNSSQVATGLKFYSIKLYTTKLDASSAASAMNDVILYNGASKTATEDAQAIFCSGSGSGVTLNLAGHNVSLLETYTGPGAITVNDSVGGGVLDVGTFRPAIASVAAGGTLALSADVTMSERLTGYTPTATLPVTGDLNGTVTLNGETVTSVVDGGTATLAGAAVAGDPTYTGNGWWWDFEFNGNGNNIGSQNTGLNWDSSRPTASGQSAAALGDYTEAVDGNQMVHLLARPWRHVDGAGGQYGASGYPSEFTAVMFCKAGSTANGVLVAFGSSNRGSSPKTIALATGDHPENGEMRLVLINGSSSAAVDLVEGGFTLDNITSANHLYAFTVQTVGNVSHVAVYADGDLLTTYVSDGIIALGNGFQIGSIHGSITTEMGLKYLADGTSGSPDEATMDFLRVSNVALSEAAIKALAAEYRYVSPNGIAERTLSANATWTDETNNSWSQKTLNEDGSTTTTAQAAPNSGTVVEITASTDVQLTMDLASDVSYEKLTFQGDGAITVKAGGTAPTVTTRTYINTDVTMDIAAFASLGATTIADGKTLTVVPDETSTLNAGIALGIRGETSTIVTGTVTLGTGSQVVLPSSMVSKFAGYGFTLTLTPDASGRYVYTIARDDNPVHVTKAANGTIIYAMYPDALAGTPAANMFTLPAEPATIPDDFEYTVTFVNNHASESLAVDTAIAGGSIAVSSGTVELSGESTVVNVSGSGTLQVTGSLAVSGTFANTLTLAGDGTVTFATLPASALTFGDWTGTVVLPQLTSIDGDSFSFNSYGVEGSTVRVSGIGGGWIKNEEVNPTIDIPEDVTLTISDFSPSFNNTFKALSGAGTFEVTYNTAIDTTSGSWSSNYSAYYLVKNVSKFTGSLSTATPGIAIGSAKPQYQIAGGKIYLASDVTLTVPSTSSIAPALAGEGRIVFDGALPTLSTLLTSLQDENNWTGTVEIKDYEETADSFGIIKFGDYGNRESAIALNGVTSTMFTGNGIYTTYPDVTLKEIEICEGGWTDKGGTYSINPTYTANLTGHGCITITTGDDDGDYSVKFIGNHTFDGSVEFGANTGKRVAFMKTSTDTLPSTFEAKSIVVAGRTNMSIASGKSWKADAIKIDGSLTVLTAKAAEATSVTPTAYLDGATITTTVDDEAGTTTYVTDKVTQISDNQATLGAVTVSEPMRMTGSGGALMSSLTINDGMTLTYDPVITPIRVESAPVFNGTGKLKLAARYAGVTCGKFHLVTYPSESFNGYSEEALKALVDSSSFNNTEYTVSEVEVALTGKQEDLSFASTDLWQLVLKVGNYDEDAKDVSIAQFGDSITEGIWRDGRYTSDGNAYRGTPNYRIPLMQLLEAYGYRPEARGYREIGSMDANGVLADDNYKWHTGISAQRIYTGGSTRAGFMESIEAHLEQVGVTDIITLKIGTNDAIGGESADNMFEGWSNLVWKIVRMRPTSKIVVCAPINIHSGGENNAPGLRQKIAEYVNKTPDQGGFPANQVTLINGSPDGSNNYSGTEIIPADDNYYMIGSVKTDRVHPNWNGHLRLANAWLPAVTNAFESMKVNDVIVHAEDTYTPQPAVNSAENVDDDDFAAYREGYVKLATFTNIGTKLNTWGETPYSWVNEAYRTKPMRRVAYFVARKTKASPDTRYVWVDMDADSTTGTTLAAFGMPTNAAVNGVVNNLHIYSNSSAIENVAPTPTVSGVRGTLMRTEKGVSKTDDSSLIALGVPTGPYGFDWNDSINGSGAWGVMNMARIFDGVTPTTHRRLLAAQMLFDFNGFNGGRQNALGIGNFAVHGPYLYGNGAVQNLNLNWSFTTDQDEMPTMDARELESGVIEIWGIPDVATVTFSNEDGSVTLQSSDVKIGTEPVFSGSTEKAATAEYTYTFKGWANTPNGETLSELPLVTADGATYYAVYTATVNNYKVTIPAVDHATAVVTVGENVIPLADGGYTVPYGSTVKITYTADEGYFFGNSTEKVIEIEVEGDTAVTAEQAGSTTAAVAQDSDGGYYPTVYSALEWLAAPANFGAGYVQLLGETVGENIYGDFGVGYDAAAKRYAKAAATVSGTTAGYLTVQEAIDTAANEGTVNLKADNAEALTLAYGKTVTINAKAGSDIFTYTAPVAEDATYKVVAGETVSGATTFTGTDWDTWTLALGTHPNATVTDLPVEVSEGDAVADRTVSFTVTADATYKVTAVKVDGAPLVGDNGTYTYTVSGDATVTVETELDVATFSVSVPNHATIKSVSNATNNGDGTYTATIGTTVTVTFAAEEGYFLSGETTKSVTVTAGMEPIEADSSMVVNATVAMIDTTPYASLQAAFGAAGDGNTVTLLQNVALTGMIDVDKAVTLDLNGKTVSVGTWQGDKFQDALFCVKYNGSLTIDDSTGGTIANPTGDGAIDATGNPNKVYAAIKLTRTGEVRSGDEVATLVVNGGTITGYYYAITGNGSRHGTAITVNGGALSGTCPGDNLGIYHPQSGTLRLNGGTITGVTGVEMRAGELVVPADSTVVVTATGTFDEEANGSGSTVKGAAIALSQHSTNRTIDANIQGGKFYSTGDDGVAFYVTDTVNADPTGVEATLAGGTFYAPVVIDASAADVGTVIPSDSTAFFSDAEADGLAENTYLAYDSVSGLYQVVEVTLDPASLELYPNCSNYVYVVGAPEGSTYRFTFAGAVGSGGYSSTLGWGKPYGKNPGAGTVTAIVSNNNEQVAMLVADVTVKDVVAVVAGTEYATAEWADAVSAAITSGEILEVYYNVANIYLEEGQTLRWKAADNRGQGRATVLAPAATETAMYKVTSTKVDGVTTAVCTNEGAPNVMIVKSNNTVSYSATLSMTAANATYKLLRSFTKSGNNINASAAGVVLDLNGQTLTLENSYIYVRNLSKPASLTVRDTSANGTGAIVSDGGQMFWAHDGDAVTIEGGMFTGSTALVYTSGNGTATVAGGKFSMTGTDKKFLLNCQDNNRGTISVTGGLFEGFDPAVSNDGDMVAEGKISIPAEEEGWYTVVDAVAITLNPPTGLKIDGVTADGAAVTGNNGVYTVGAGQQVAIAWSADGQYIVKDNTGTASFTATTDAVFGETEGYDFPEVSGAVAQVGDTPYGSLEAAVDAATDGDTVTLLADVALTRMVDIDKAVTLDLNGKTVSVGTWANGDGDDALFCVKYCGALTVNDSSDSSTGAIDATGNGAKVYAAIKLTRKGEVRSGVEIASLTINGGTITGYYYAITGNGSRHGTEIAVNGGALVGTCSGDNLGIYHPQSGTLRLNGGTITGVTGVEMRAGELVVPANSTVVVTATGTFDEEANGSGSTVKGAAIAISQHSTNRTIDADIQGGEFYSTGNDGVSFYVTDTVNADPTGVEATLAGGTFYAPVVVDDSAADVGTVIPSDSTALFSDAEADGLAENTYLAYDEASGLYQVVAVTLDPASLELYPNCSNYVYVVGAPEGSTYRFTFAGAVGSGGYSSTLGWGKPYGKNPGAGTVTAIVSNNNEQVAMLVADVTVKDVVAVVAGTEYATAEWADAVSAAITSGEILEVYYNVANITLAEGQTLRWKAADNRGKATATTLAPAANENAMYKVVKTTQDGVTTATCVNDGAPNVMIVKANNTVSYSATLTPTTANATYKLLRSFTKSGSNINASAAGVVLDLNGQTLTLDDSFIYIRNLTKAASLTVRDTSANGTGAIVSNRGQMFWADASDAVTIEGGTFTGTTALVYTTGSGTATVAGGTFAMTGTDKKFLFNCEDSNRGTITVAGGTFEGFDPADSNDGDMVATGKISIPAAQEGWYTVVDAVAITLNPPTGLKIDGVTADGVAVAGDNGVYTVGAGQQIEIAWSADGQYIVTANTGTASFTATADAVFGETEGYDFPEVSGAVVEAFAVGGESVGYFSDVNAAIEAAGNGCTIKLVAEITKQVQINSQMTPVTIDLNGNWIRVDQGAGINLSMGYYWNGDHILTIKDSIGTGGIDITPKYTGNACVSDNVGRTVIIESGTFTSTGKAIYNTGSNASMTIKGGMFEGTIYVHDTGYGAGSLAIEDGSFEGELVTGGDNATIAVSGGTFSAVVPEEYCAEGFAPTTIADANGKYTVDTARTVTFKVDKTETTQLVADGEPVAAPATPSKGEGWEFTKWTLDDEEYDFTTPVTADITLVANFVAMEGIVVTPAVPVTVDRVTTVVAVPKSVVQLTAATLIKTENREAGDQLMVYNGSTYYSWTYNGTDAWTPNQIITGDTPTYSPAPDTIQLTTGQGVWVTYNPTKELVLNGIAATAGETPVYVTSGYNLIAPPPTGAATYSLSSIDGAAAGDKIIVPSPTGGAPVNITYKNYKWGYWVKVSDTQVEWKEDAAVPAGTGFWYVPANGSKQISL